MTPATTPRTRSSYTNAAIYWLNGSKVADNYGDLYDGTWDDEANPRDRAGSTSSKRTFYTGTADNGRKSTLPLGGSTVSIGKLNDGGTNENPLGSSAGLGSNVGQTRPYYALSGVFVVPFTNAVPEFSAETATRTLPENSGAGVNVVGGVITATDSDSGDTLTYSLTGTDGGSFEIDSSGQLKTKTGVTHSFDFESATKSYSVTVEVSDSKDAAGNADTAVDDTIAVAINLTNVNEAPTITNLLDTPNVPENSSGTILLMASDVDVPDTQTWSVESSDDGPKFQVASGFLATLSFKDQPDFETPTDLGDTAGNNTYVVTVKLTDSGGLSDTLTFTVTVTNVNEAPVFTSPPATVDFAENGTGTVVDFDATDVDRRPR